MLTWLNNQKIQTKVISAFVMIILINGIAVGWGIWSILQIEAETQDIVRELKELITLKEIQVTLLAQELTEKDFLLTGDTSYIENHQLFEKEIDNLLNEVRRLEFHTVGADIIEDLTTEKGEYEINFDKIISTYNAGQVNEAVRLSIEVSDSKIKDIHKQVEQLIIAGQITIDQETKQANQHTISSILIALFGLAISFCAGGGIGLVLSHNIVGSLNKLSKAATAIAQGDLSQTVTISVTDEVGQVAHNFNQMTVALRESQEALKARETETRDVLDRAVTGIQILSAGDYNVEFTPESQDDVLGIALQKITHELKTVTATNERQLWLSAGQAQMNDTMRGIQDETELARNIIQFLCNYLAAQVGVIYLLQGEVLELVDSYAYVFRENQSNRFKIGEGLVGQAAREKKPIVFYNMPDTHLTVTSGLREVLPTNVLASPFMYEEQVIGVVEIGSLSEFSQEHIEFLQMTMENIAISFNAAQARQRLQTLLEETQQQAQALQVREEELRATNEELETQTQSLKESEERLREQQVELEITNAKLEEQADSLREQQIMVDSKNKELVSAQTELEQRAEELALASKYKSEFLANMSHELRTPLNSLLILAGMFKQNKEGNLTTDQVESATIIYNGGQDLLNLINEILDLSKVEAGKMEFRFEPVSLADLAESMQIQFGHVAEEKELAFNVSLDSTLPATITTDPQRVKQIIKNLLSNAFKFTEHGEVTLNIQRPPASTNLFYSKLNPTKAIAIQVCDTGIGLSSEQQKVIFEAFQQADGTTSRRYGGTGLGLSISRELAFKLGGEIRLTSTVGQGSQFTLYLPEQMAIDNLDDLEITLPPQSTQPTETPLPESLSSQSEPLPIKQSTFSSSAIKDDRANLTTTDKTLLIVEDDHKFAKIVQDLAKQKEFKTLVAHNGRNGLTLAKQYTPQAVILDLNLPDMSGWEVLAYLKGSADLRHIPVHIMSAYDETLDAYKRGAIGYLTKPVQAEGLEKSFNTIESFITRPIKTLLLVEDNATLRHSVTKLLAGDEVKIVEAGTGQAALDILAMHHVDCMILDLTLPDMTGFELLSKLSSNEGIIKCPIIVYTGQELTPEENAELLKYADSIIVKGVKSLERLLDETTLFLHQVVADMPPDKQQTLKQLYDRETVLTDKRVLVVDDDVRNSFALSKLLTDKGLKVHIAVNGQKALIALKKHPNIDLVLMDIMMPIMDGYETMRRIREQVKFRNLPIIALTAKAMKGDRDKCIEAGANDYLTKPINTDRLFSMLRVWLY